MSTGKVAALGSLPFSGHEIKKLGNRIRDGGREQTDIGMLEALRTSYDPLLIEMSARIDSLLAKNGFRHLLSGRSKRTKSIIRKLQRPTNHGMDLSRLGDMVGLRVILPSIAEQDRAIAALSTALDHKRVNDYRNGGKLYRSVHIIVREGVQYLEIQLRTLPQHVWAVESEIFGEQVKAGSLTGDIGEYLRALSVACAELDNGKRVSESSYAETPFIEQRAPISGMLAQLTKKFTDATQDRTETYDGATFLVVFDNELRQLLHNIAFSAASRSAAIEHYRRLSRSMSDVRFEVLIFNSSSSEALAVTHPRFFL
jgi:ppGpp synthetase/RelA/SpoT-type nucleotidyltranferase